MTTKSKKKSTKKPVTPSAGRAIPHEYADGIRESFSKSQAAGMEHNKLRREFLAFEKQALETQALYEREFSTKVEAAAREFGLDPAQHTINLQTMTFERKR